MGLLIVGCGGHGAVVSEIATRCGAPVSLYLDAAATELGGTFLGRPVLATLEQPWDGDFLVAIGDNYTRQQVFALFSRENPAARPATLVDPSSVVSSSAVLGEGCVVMPLAVVNAGSRIGPGVILNTRSSVDHDNALGAFSSLAPAVALGGDVRLGDRSALGIGSIVSHGVAIGNDVVLGAGALALRDLPDACLAYGVPAKVIRSRRRDEPYLQQSGLSEPA